MYIQKKTNLKHKYLTINAMRKKISQDKIP